ncbi:hypothetical protein CQW23_23310 [Capsicum baccatum]|uniref:Uncharacterized protein n=1 Tax=Capsicum baccatum TaxID=33114 RepID=A0A2G2VRL3_CAPBA|nr:hypothetical protein CQW23_23310 [Capsicum baccatum]
MNIEYNKLQSPKEFGKSCCVRMCIDQILLDPSIAAMCIVLKIGKKIIHPKGKEGSNRKTKAEAAENVSKRNKINEKVSKSDPNLKEISNYVESSEDVLPERSVSRDSEESKGSGRNNDDGENDPLSMLSLSRFISVEWYDLRTIMHEVGSFPTKISIRSRMAAYREFKQVFVDQELKKRFKWSCFGHLRNLSEHLKFNGQLVWMYEAFPYLEKSMDEPFPISRILRCDDDEDLGGNPVEVSVADDDTSSTSKDAVGTLSPEDHHKLIVALEKAMLDIAAYIRDKRLKKKEQDERQLERVHVDLLESEKNEEEKEIKMNELASIVAKEGKEEEKKDEEEEMKEYKRQEESVKETAATKE